MAYDEQLAARLRAALGDEPGLTEKRMFGGLAFLVDGHMAAAASGQGGMLLRVDPAQTEELAGQADVERFQMRGKEMDGWLRVGPSAVRTDEELQGWLDRALAYVRSLPPK
jgi:hypothetical protein